jgi:hypothetical protein
MPQALATSLRTRTAFACRSGNGGKDENPHCLAEKAALPATTRGALRACGKFARRQLLAGRPTLPLTLRQDGDGAAFPPLPGVYKPSLLRGRASAGGSDGFERV